ncbi:MAG: sulfatase [Proteobacteria bacterium]|nr:sulfatase [Pseudomonadota bacterium]
MRGLPLLLLLACGTSDPAQPEVPDVPPLPMDQTGAGHTQRLTAETATLILPEREATKVETTFTLTQFTQDAYFGGCLTADLPFTLNRAQERNQPDGITVTVDGREVPYVPWAHPATEGWRISRGELHLVSERPETGVVLSYPNLAGRADRYEPAAAGLDPVAFVDMTYSAGAASRPGLLLPAPASASWNIQIKPGQRFEAAVAIAEAPGLHEGSDGVWATLQFREGEKTTVLDRKFVGAEGWLSKTMTSFDLRVEDPFEPWTVDLSSVEGRTGSLEIVSEPYKSEARDYLFVAHPAVSSPATAPPRHVVVIGLDTTRPDHLGMYGYDRDTSPELDAWALGGAVFDSAWAPAPRTRPSFRSATTGRYPLMAVGATTIGRVFHDNGFATAGIVANVHLNPRFSFNDGFDVWRLDPKSTVDTQVDLALEWLKAHRHRDTYLFLHVIDPHLFYKPPAPYSTKFVDNPDPNMPPEFNRWSTLRMDREGALTDQRKAHMVGLYDGEIAYTSAELGRFLAGLDALGGQSLVVMHSDHGEEFWEHGGFEHNHTLYDEVTKAMLVVRPPGGLAEPVRANVPATLADIAPTLYDYVGFENTPETDGISLRPFIEGADADAHADRAIGLAHLMYDREQWGVVYKGHKYIITTATGEEWLFDLEADPGESQNLASDTDLEPYRQALSSAHLGMEVGPGLRLDFSLTEAISVRLPAPAVAFGIIDPEAQREGRANEAWGETPQKTAAEVGTLTLSDDGLTITVTPDQGRGIGWVRFDDPHTTADVRTLRDGKPTRLFRRRGVATWEAKGEHLVITAGTVFQTPATEASRIAELGDADTEEVELLHALGYMGGASGTKPEPKPKRRRLGEKAKD